MLLSYALAMKNQSNTVLMLIYLVGIALYSHVQWLAYLSLLVLLIMAVYDIIRAFRLM